MNELQAYFERMELDPQATSRTLPRAHERVTGDALLDATREVLRLSRGERDSDDRDSLQFQTAHDASDLLAEKIGSDQHGVLRSLLWKVTNNPDRMMRTPPGLLDRHVDSLILESGLAQQPEEINPLDLVDQNLSITRLGEGAMSNIQSVPKEARNVSPSHAGYIDPVRSPESIKVGIDVSLASNVRKGSDGQLYKQFVNQATGKSEWVGHKRASSSVVAIPSREWNAGYEFVPAFVPQKGIQYVPRKDVQLFLPKGEDLFNEMTSLTPGIGGIKGMRLLMGSKYVRQAVPVVGGEAPLVQSMAHDGRTVPERLGMFAGAMRAGDDEAGVVTRVTKGLVEITTKDGRKVVRDMWQDHPFSRMTAITSTPVVKPGDRVAAGDLIARSNFTDEKGHFAAGTNLRVAWMPARGWTYEDSAVISRSAANRLGSRLMMSEKIDADPGLKFDRKRFLQLFPGRFTMDQLNKLDDNGVAKAGAVLEFGDPIYVAVKDDPGGPTMKGRRPVRQEVETWNYNHSATVAHADKSKKGYNVFLDTTVPMQVGDKLSGSSGWKSTVGRIMEDEAMIRDSSNRPLDIVTSSLGVISRTNPTIIHASKLGKVARHDGRPYILGAFQDEDLAEIVARELEKRGIPDREDVFDPTVGRSIKQIGTGEMYFYKMPQLAEKKGKSRGTGAYTADDEPTKRDGEMAKHYGPAEYNALLSHGVGSTVLKDMKLVRGQRDDRFMRMFKMGETPPMPSTPAVYGKFVDMMKAAGIDLDERQGSTSLFAMTDGRARELTGRRRLDNAETFGANTGRPVAGGLFDPDLGGPESMRWSYFESPEPMLNPLMEPPARSILGLTGKEFDAIVSGERVVDGRTGFDAIGAMLKRIDLDDVVAHAKQEIRAGAKSKRDAAVKRLNYADAMRKQGVKPADFLMTRIPVLPARWRPISSAGGKTLVADANYLYRALHDSMKDYEEARETLPEDQVGLARKDMYDAYRALVGTIDPAAEKLQQKRVEGMLSQLAGKGSPKTGFIQRRVLGFNSDFTGQGVITLNPNLDMDHIGLPREEAWKLYEPHIVRSLVRSGMPATMAAKAVATRSESANRALHEVVKERPVLMNRAPTLHRTSVLAMWPKIVDGHAIQIPAALTQPMNADMDGDTMSYSVPMTAEAVRDAVEKMLPSRQLLSTADDGPVFKPRQDYLMGLWQASRDPKPGKARSFRTAADAVRAWKKGEIDVDDPVTIIEQ